MLEVFKEMFGESWFKAMESYLSSGSFAKLGQTIHRERLKYNVYPTRKDLFKCFRLTPYEDVSVVLLGQDPYHNKDSADGLAFSNSQAKSISPSLRNIIREINLSYPEWKNEIDYGRLDKMDLSRWATQGVFLFNTAQTVIEKSPGSHIRLWKPFTVEVIKTLNKRMDIIWILLGLKAQELIPVINTQHCILKAAHPAAEVYGNGGFFNSNVFKICNEELEKRNKSIINW